MRAAAGQRLASRTGPHSIPEMGRLITRPDAAEIDAGKKSEKTWAIGAHAPLMRGIFYAYRQRIQSGGHDMRLVTICPWCEGTGDSSAPCTEEPSMCEVCPLCKGCGEVDCED